MPKVEMWFYDLDFKLIAKVPLGRKVELFNESKEPLHVAYEAMVIHDGERVYGKMTSRCEGIPAKLLPGQRLRLTMTTTDIRREEL